MVKTTISNNGVIQSPGAGVTITADTMTITSGTGVSPFALTPKAQTDTRTLTSIHAGNMTLSSSTGGAKTLTMPVANTVPGAFFTVLSLSADAHVLTASGEPNGTKAFTVPTCGIDVTGSSGSKVTLEAVASSSIALICDGVNYLVIGGSGTITFSGE